MRVDYTERSREDIRAIHDFLRRSSATHAAAVVSDIRAAVGYIRQQPRGSQETDVPHLHARLVKGRPYKVFYRLRPEGAEIVHVRHTSQQSWNLI